MTDERPAADRQPRIGGAAAAMALGLSILSGACQAQQVATYGLSTKATDWLAMSVCADANDHPIGADPYYDCPAGTHLRKIRMGEKPSYHNLNQNGNLENDSFILSDRMGQPLYFRTMDWGPRLGRFANNVDGYDTYVLGDGWVAINATKAGGPGGVTFFGLNCARAGAWPSYPLNGFLSEGTAHTQIASRLWEQSGGSFPGTCPPARAYQPLQTDWRLQRGFVFGGVRNEPKKVMDTIISVHGFQDNPNFLQHGHIEVFYFTQQYGLTRWESWTPVQHGASINPNNCGVQEPFSYRGVVFVVSDCQDYSRVVPARPTDEEVWPLPQANLLTDSHFTEVRPAGPGSGWKVSGSRPESTPNWRLFNSRAKDDTLFRPEGVRTVALDCRGRPGCGALFQDVPAAMVPPGLYLIGASVRTAPGTRGNFRVALQALDASGKILWVDWFELPIESYNGSHPGMEDEAVSVYRSTAFPHKIVRVAAVPGAATFRLTLTAAGDAEYHVTEGWFNRWPANWDGPVGVASN